MTQKELRDDILDGTKSWNKEIVKGVPLFFLYYYFPKEVSTNQYNEWARKLIWDFKDGQMKYQCATMVTKVLQHFFLKETLASLTFICIPASTKKKNEARYRGFSNRVSENCNMSNGYDHVKLKYDREAKHLSGEKDFDNLDFDREWFKGKRVVIFDDIVTSGSSISNLKKELKKMGATVIGAITLGRTVHEEHDKSPYKEMDKTIKPVPPKPVDDNKQTKKTRKELSVEESIRLFEIYKDVEHVALKRGLTFGTICSHLFSSGTINPHTYITEEEYVRASHIYEDGNYENPSKELDKFLNRLGKAAYYYIRRENSSQESDIHEKF